MNYVHVLFLAGGSSRPWFGPLSKKPPRLASLALFLGMIAIWAQVIATL